MSIKLAFLLLVGLIVLAGALPAKDDEPEDDSATDLQDPAEDEAADPGSPKPKRKPIYCWRHSKRRRNCRKRCVYDKVRKGKGKYGKYYKKKRCFRLCCDYIYKKTYICGYCYWGCAYGGYPCRWRCGKVYG